MLFYFLFLYILQEPDWIGRPNIDMMRKLFSIMATLLKFYRWFTYEPLAYLDQPHCGIIKFKEAQSMNQKNKSNSIMLSSLQGHLQKTQFMTTSSTYFLPSSNIEIL